MGSEMRDVICKICDIGEKSFYVWRNKSHKKLINLLTLYFTKKDLEEFLATGRIEKFDIINQNNFINQKILHKFFFEEYTNQRINLEFSDFLFPAFLKHIDNLIEKEQEKYSKQKFVRIKYFTKTNFYKFLIENDEIVEKIKTKFNYADNSLSSYKSDFIDDLSEISESDFFIILTSYESYLFN